VGHVGGPTGTGSRQGIIPAGRPRAAAEFFGDAAKRASPVNTLTMGFGYFWR